MVAALVLLHIEDVTLGETDLAHGRAVPSLLHGRRHCGNEVELAGHEAAQVHHAGGAEVSLDHLAVGERRLRQRVLIRTTQQQIRPQRHDVHHRQKQHGQALLLLVRSDGHQQLRRATHNDVIVGGLDHREAHGPFERVGLVREHLLVTVHQHLCAQTRQFNTLGLELLRGQELHVLHLGQLHQDRDHHSVPIGGGGALQVQSVGENGAQHHAGGGLLGAAVHGQEGVGDDGAHGSPGADVDVDGHVGHNRRVLQSVVVDHTHDALNLNGFVELTGLLVVHETHTSIGHSHKKLLNRHGSSDAPMLQTELCLRVNLRSSGRGSAVQFSGAN
eukprot:Colp12_sorted_trinity150504_noHs@23170